MLEFPHQCQYLLSSTEKEGAVEKEQVEDDDEESEDEDLAEPDEDDSDLDLAWKMLDLARAIAEKNPNDTMEKVDILSALGEVALERGHLIFLTSFSFIPSFLY